jgi:cytochrome c551/c552
VVRVTGAYIPAAPAGGAEAAAAGPAPTATMEPMALLTEKGCLGCHVIDGAGPPIGPPFDGIGRRISADRIRKGILEPNAEVAAGFEKFAGMMPATFGEQLSAAQLEVLVQFLASRR